MEAQHDAEMRVIERHFAAKRRHLRSMQKAREILGEEKFWAAQGSSSGEEETAMTSFSHLR